MGRCRGNSTFIPEGRELLREEEWYREKEREIREAVERKYASQLASAGFLDRCLLEVTMWREIRRKAQELAPKDGLYLRSR